MREEYEAWFIGKFGFPPMPIHSRVLDFCWEGYQAGRKTSDAEIERLKGMVDEIQAARKVNSDHDKLLVQLAVSKKQVALLRDALKQARHMIYYGEPQIGWNITRIDEVIEATKDQGT